MPEFDCPYCGGQLHEITIDGIQGRYIYYECFGCGYCSDITYEDGFDFADPDIEIGCRQER